MKYIDLDDNTDGPADTLTTFAKGAVGIAKGAINVPGANAAGMQADAAMTLLARTQQAVMAVSSQKMAGVFVDPGQGIFATFGLTDLMRPDPNQTNVLIRQGAGVRAASPNESLAVSQQLAAAYNAMPKPDGGAAVPRPSPVDPLMPSSPSAPHVLQQTSKARVIDIDAADNSGNAIADSIKGIMVNAKRQAGADNGDQLGIVAGEMKQANIGDKPLLGISNKLNMLVYVDPQNNQAAVFDINGNPSARIAGTLIFDNDSPRVFTAAGGDGMQEVKRNTPGMDRVAQQFMDTVNGHDALFASHSAQPSLPSAKPESNSYRP